MKIALHDSDNTGFPNLALMKLSAYHKGQRDDVSFYEPMLKSTYDKIYSSKVFDTTPDDIYLSGNVEKGGAGYDMKIVLPDEIEHICPDYILYNAEYSMGFITRGCPRNCDFCIVPRKEGKIRFNTHIEEFVRHKNVVFMDNNVLASEEGIQEIEKISKLNIRIDFNQGLDARKIDDGIARILAACKWHKPIRLACDAKSQMKHIQRAVTLLRWYNATPKNYIVYVLIKDIPDALERIKFLKGLGLAIYAQPFLSKDSTPTKEQRALRRWVNGRYITVCTWEEYGKQTKDRDDKEQEALPWG